jgi:hypothetical protein
VKDDLATKAAVGDRRAIAASIIMVVQGLIFMAYLL